MSGMAVWGIHNDSLSDELVEGGFVSIGWDRIGDLRAIGLDRGRLKSALTEAYPDDKPRAIAGRAGTMLRFARDIQEGDLVVAPNRSDSTINLGVVTGPYEHHPEAETHRHRRTVEWKKLGVSRTVFTQAALYEIGSLLAVFGIRKHPEEFLTALGTSVESLGKSKSAERSVEEADDNERTSIDEPRASRIERHTRDYVLDCLKHDLNHQEFEEFIADLLRAMGYEARVTAYSQDGGVDVIAHRDPLGVEPPLIKVQVKHTTNPISAPTVQQLIGTQASNELSLLVTLGTYTRDAVSIERVRQGLRLITGEDLITDVLRNYDRLPARWRSRMPLRGVLVVDDSAGI